MILCFETLNKGKGSKVSTKISPGVVNIIYKPYIYYTCCLDEETPEDRPQNFFEIALDTYILLSDGNEEEVTTVTCVWGIKSK